MNHDPQDTSAPIIAKNIIFCPLDLSPDIPETLYTIAPTIIITIDITPVNLSRLFVIASIVEGISSKEILPALKSVSLKPFHLSSCNNDAAKTDPYPSRSEVIM